VEQASTYSLACEGCSRFVFELRVVDGAKLCGTCSDKSERIDRRLATTMSEDPVFCDGCGERAEFDARTAVVVRECGGQVFCGLCEPITAEGEPS
jgi:hypothetical protein